MSTNAAKPSVRVESISAEECRIRIVDRAGIDDDTLRELLLSVYRNVNPAAPLDRSPEAVLTSEYFKALYAEGPRLFSVAAATQTGATSEHVGGLLVSRARLQATLEQLRQLGFSDLS